ncbi:Histone transcription regulator 3 like protein [Fusarium odoratissimum]|uniref:Histone transcription regulator 3 like protein n=1 Tax=Fusarium oxysporum f. sp. cubense (strain race 4) TaxID=2502994 RepID=N1RJX3_FUSC4|nr:Histone transcription regulator 3 like protein [Fusarium odoratissimum]
MFLSLSSEEFEVIGERIADWAASDGADIPLFNCMKETIELKKLNANLMKVAPIDDLLNDCYSRIYSEIAKTLPGPDPSKVVEERHHAKEVAAQLEAAQAEAKATSSLANILNAPNGQESITGTATPMETEKHEAAPRARKLGVRRPDVLRKAEQAVVRALEAPKSSKSRVGSVSSGKRGSHTPIQHASDAGSDEEADAQIRREAGHDVDVDMKDAGDEHEEEHEEDHEDHEEEHDEDHEDGVDDDNGEEHAEDKAESEPGSIHDSADDESDLSDVPEDYDEEVPPGLIFPNLRQHTDESSGEDADSESEGDDEAEESDGEEEAEEEEEHDESREDGEETLGNEDTELADGEEEEDEVDGDERRENWDADDSVRAEAW